MKQYQDLLFEIIQKGSKKGKAREGMPQTISIFGHQSRYDLSKGFPLITTKPVYWKGVVVELLWFLRGESNIKFMLDNGVDIWLEDSYTYYEKIASKNTDDSWNAIYMQTSNSKRGVSKEEVTGYSMFNFEEYSTILKNNTLEELKELFSVNGYTLGDTGKQYPKLWRDFGGIDYLPPISTLDYLNLTRDQTEGFSKQLEESFSGIMPLTIDTPQKSSISYICKGIDQIKDLLIGLIENPFGRRHIITAWNPNTLDDMALNACHTLVQFNCRPISFEDRVQILFNSNLDIEWENLAITEELMSEKSRIPKYYLDCQIYQRSADSVLGVPFNIASYSLLTEIFAKFLNMVSGDFIHSFGDTHIYEDHIPAVEEQLKRIPQSLPKLQFSETFERMISNVNKEDITTEERVSWFLESIQQWDNSMFRIENYSPYPKLTNPTTLYTGIKK